MDYCCHVLAFIAVQYLSSRVQSLAPVDLADLPVQRPEIVQQSQTQQSAGEQEKDAGDPLAQIEPVDAEYAQKG